MKKIDETTVETPGGEVDVATVQTPQGRAGVLTKFMKANPDFKGEPTDEQLWEYAGGDYDSLKDTHKKVMAGQQGLHDYVARDPRFGAAIGMSFGEGEDKVPFTRALGRLYGPDAFSDDEELSKGFEEFNENLKKTRESAEEAQKNFDTLTAPRLDQFAKENNLTEDQVDSIFQGLDAMASAMFMGDVPLDIIALVHKGLNYDTDVQEAATTGEIEGKNKKIRAEMGKKIPQEGIVDLGAGTGAMGQKEKVMPEEKNTGFTSMLKDVE